MIHFKTLHVTKLYIIYLFFWGGKIIIYYKKKTLEIK